MEKEILFTFNLTYYNGSEVDTEQNKSFHIFSGILSFMCTIPNLISIIIILFKKNVNSFYKRIQIILCISYIGIEIKYYPIIINIDKIYKIFYFIQFSVSYTFLVLSNYYQFIHSYIAYKLFTSPNDLSTKCNIFFIYFFPLILLIFSIILVVFNYKLTLYFDFIAYPNHLDENRIYDIVAKIFGVCRIGFFLLNIIYIFKLLRKIKQVLTFTINIDKKFANKKYKIYKNKLIWYIIAMVFVMHPYLLKKPIAAYLDLEDKEDILHNYPFSYYYHGIEILSGLIYWYIYIYNKNIIRRILIVFCCKKERDYLNEFIEEKKMYEESVKTILSAEQTFDMSTYNISSNITSINKTEQKNDVDDFKVESLIDDETL